MTSIKHPEFPEKPFHLLRINAGGRFVHDQYFAVAKNGPRQAKQLSLAGAKIRSPFDQFGVQTGGAIRHDMLQFNLWWQNK